MSDYNGWKNYETWCVNLWLDKDEGNYHAVRELAVEASNAYALSLTLREYVEDLPECATVRETASFVSDLLGAALSEVDWDEIAENLIHEIQTEDA